MVNSLGSFFIITNLKNPYLFPPPDPTNYDKATYIVSSNLCLFTCSQTTGFPWNPYPQRQKGCFCKKGVSQIHPHVMFDVNFWNNISIPSQYKENWTNTTFKISELLKLLGENFHNSIVQSQGLIFKWRFCVWTYWKIHLSFFYEISPKLWHDLTLVLQFRAISPSLFCPLVRSF